MVRIVGVQLRKKVLELRLILFFSSTYHVRYTCTAKGVSRSAAAHRSRNSIVFGNCLTVKPGADVLAPGVCMMPEANAQASALCALSHALRYSSCCCTARHERLDHLCARPLCRSSQTCNGPNPSPMARTWRAQLRAIGDQPNASEIRHSGADGEATFETRCASKLHSGRASARAQRKKSRCAHSTLRE